MVQLKCLLADVGELIVQVPRKPDNHHGLDPSAVIKLMAVGGVLLGGYLAEIKPQVSDLLKAGDALCSRHLHLLVICIAHARRRVCMFGMAARVRA